MALALAERGMVPRAGLLTPADGEAPAEGWEVKALGGESGAVRAIRMGVLPVGSLDGWTAGFLAGLLDAGACRRVGSTSLLLTDASPLWLRDELINWPPFHCEVERLGDGGVLLTEVWLLLAPTPKGGVERLAGLLAGSPQVKDKVVVRSGMSRFLRGELVTFASFRRGFVKVSPFWRALTAEAAPGRVRRWLGVEEGRAWGCPRLAGVVWAALVGGGVPSRPVRSGLPWLLSYKRMRVLRLGVRRCGGLARGWWPAGVRGWVRVCALAWMRRVCPTGVDLVELK
jgi:hypothetical protein